MCFPKAPKTDPAIIEEQKRQRQAELDRLALAKKQETAAARRAFGRGGPRSLISGASGSGFADPTSAGNYTA